MIRARQFGVAVPGGCDVLVHLRRNLEAVVSGSEVPLVHLDLDLRNAFPSLEWEATRTAVDKHFPSLSNWTRWCHQAASRVLLPDGTWHHVDRGAEQGDPLGPVYCGAVLLDVAAAARQAVISAGGWVWDAFFMDDGQVCLPPEFVSAYLQAFDSALRDVGGSRIAGAELKSTARLCGTAAAIAAAPSDWDSVAKHSCKILSRAATKVLGVGIEEDSAAAQFRTACKAARDASDALAAVADPAIELALLRRCTSVCKVTHMLRAVGPTLPLDDILAFDEGVEHALGSILGGDIRGVPLDRAVSGSHEGGLGLRRARESQLPAFLASRTEARPLAEDLAFSLPVDLRSSLFRIWDAEVHEALQRFQAELPAGCGPLVAQVLSDGAATAQQRAWVLRGEVPRPPVEAPARTHARVDGFLLNPLGYEDPEFPASERQGLQTRLCNIASGARISRIRDGLISDNDWSSVRMLDDMHDPGTDHTWLWLVASSPVPLMTLEQFRTAVRIRIGANILDSEQPCASCGQVLDRRCLHCLRCAPGESTRGHFAVASVVHGLARLSDSTASAETRGLVPSRPALRPADILTSATCGRPAALDVCVASPDSGRAGRDACAAAVARKKNRYRTVLAELEEEGYEYRPIVWSCWGRPGSEAASTVRTLAAAAARRLGYAGGLEFEARARALVGVHLWKRAAAMVLACLPEAAGEDVPDLLAIGGFAEDLSDEQLAWYQDQPDDGGVLERAGGAARQLAEASQSEPPSVPAAARLGASPA